MQLGSLLDSVPEDMNGKAGIKKDEAGLERLKERQAVVEEAAKVKADILTAMEKSSES